MEGPLILSCDVKKKPSFFVCTTEIVSAAQVNIRMQPSCVAILEMDLSVTRCASSGGEYESKVE